MEEQTFRDYLDALGIPSKEIESQVHFIHKLEDNLRKSVPSWTLEDLNHASTQAVIDDLIDRGENKLHNLQAMARYAKCIHNQAMFVTIFQLLDGYEAMENLHTKVGAFVGDDLREIVFEGMPLPPLGLSSREKARYAFRIIRRMETIFEETTCREILKDSLRFLPEHYYNQAKDDFYQQCEGDIDHYLDFKGLKFITTLRGYQSRNELFFGQEITDEVIEFVENNPEIGGGVRVGQIVYETKIPYNTKAFLAENNTEKRPYHYCHCPWARESLRKRAFMVSATFCQCSAGFHKKPYEVIYGKPLRADVLQSVLNGDAVCRFAIHLPDIDQN